MEKVRIGDTHAAGLKRRGEAASGVRIKGRWNIVCYDKNGVKKWEDRWENIVVNQGLNYLLEAGIAGGSQLLTWYVGLTAGSPTPAAGDTLASHAGWTEVSAYSGNRKAWVPGAVASQTVSNSGSPAEFAVNGSATVGGAFLCSAETGTGGLLYAVGPFSEGNRSVVNGDTLVVTSTFTAADDA